MKGSLQGRTAVVTGASSGLGERFARVLHAEGARVVAAARRVDRLDALRDELGDRLVPHGCDVAIEADRVMLIEHAGAVDILINNAGIGSPSPAEHEELADFRSTLEVNLVAVFHLCQLAGRGMLARGDGAIVNIASIFGLVAASPISHASYGATKAGVVGLTRELGAQWASRGVRVNAIAPGWFETEMTEDMWDDEGSLSYVRRGTPLGRQGRLEELDEVLLLLVGPGASFIVGQTIPVDGGWTVR